MAIVEKVDGFFIPNVTLIGVGAAKAIPERIVYLRACLETHLSIMKRFNSMLAMAI